MIFVASAYVKIIYSLKVVLSILTLALCCFSYLKGKAFLNNIYQS